ncbi:hypothetical protein [Akkermansia sp.]|uniref:hypothetical protein n=1 Tax=Akkermansia sp. TaxID=1872421 RepID=UPI003992426D
MGTDGYGYSYDNIGNRKTAQELAEELTYTANELNQYTSIANSTLNSPPPPLWNTPSCRNTTPRATRLSSKHQRVSGRWCTTRPTGRWASPARTALRWLNAGTTTRAAAT